MDMRKKTLHKEESLLEAIMECCSELEDSWISNALDIKPLNKIMDHLNDYAVDYKEDILKAFDLAVSSRRYSRVLSQDLVEAVIKYDEYQDELAEFISIIAKERRDPQKKKEILERLAKAHEVDEKFLSGLILLDDKLQPRMYPEAVMNLQTFMLLDTMIDKIKDNFINLSNITDDLPEEVISLVALYGESVNSFLTRITESLINECCRLIRFKEYHAKLSLDKYKLF